MPVFTCNSINASAGNLTGTGTGPISVSVPTTPVGIDTDTRASNCASFQPAPHVSVYIHAYDTSTSNLLCPCSCLTSEKAPLHCITCPAKNLYEDNHISVIVMVSLLSSTDTECT